jgi:DmsE family decaheme c-type cytochrome
MNNLNKLCCSLGLVLLGLGGATFGMAAEPASAPAAATASAVPDRTLEGDKACTRCHDENETRAILSIYKTRHGVKADERTPGCQSCHGASLAHQKNIGGTGDHRTPPDITFGLHGKSDAQAQAGACLNCHANGKRALWGGSEHESRDIPCAGCHSVHVASDPIMSKATQEEVCFTCHKTQRAQTHLASTHPLAAGKMACSDCHNPHGSAGPHLLAKNSVNETCYTCHAEKRGPFLWEHGPVTDECSNCHTPHGSNTTPLLKARVPFLCQECHSGDHGAQVNSGANLQDGGVTTVNGINPLASAAARAQLTGRACLNCHVLIHGSNSPAGAKFQR